MGYLEDNRDKNQSTPGGELCQVFGASEKANASIALVKMYVGEQGEYHYHDNITETYVFAKGNGRIIINGIEHEIFPGDVYEIPPKNGHLIIADSEMEFECICTPPWEERHEFIIPEGEIINGSIIEKKQDFTSHIKLNNNGEISIQRLNSGTTMKNVVGSNYVEVYYFSVGTGKILINGFEKEIHEGECFLVNPNDTVAIRAETDITFSKVKDQNVLSLNRKKSREVGDQEEVR